MPRLRDRVLALRRHVVARDCVVHDDAAVANNVRAATLPVRPAASCVHLQQRLARGVIGGVCGSSAAAAAGRQRRPAGRRYASGCPSSSLPARFLPPSALSADPAQVARCGAQLGHLRAQCGRRATCRPAAGPAWPGASCCMRTGPLLSQRQCRAARPSVRHYSAATVKASPGLRPRPSPAGPRRRAPPARRAYPALGLASV